MRNEREDKITNKKQRTEKQQERAKEVFDAFFEGRPELRKKLALKVELEEERTVDSNPTSVEQFNGREGETVALLFSLSVTFDVDAGSFAPRHLNRSTLRG